MGTGSLIRSGETPTFSLVWGHWEGSCLQASIKVLNQTQPCWLVLISDFSLQIVRKQMPVVSATLSMLFCWGKLSWQIHYAGNFVWSPNNQASLPSKDMVGLHFLVPLRVENHLILPGQWNVTPKGDVCHFQWVFNKKRRCDFPYALFFAFSATCSAPVTKKSLSVEYWMRTVEGKAPVSPQWTWSMSEIRVWGYSNLSCIGEKQRNKTKKQ